MKRDVFIDDRSYLRHKDKGWEREKTEVEFQELFAKNYAALKRRVTPFLNDLAVVEDVVQEAFLQLYLRPPPREENISGWLFRVAINLAYNHMRKEERRKRRERRNYREEIAVSGEEIIQKEEVQKVRNALARLHPRDRFSLLLQANGYSYAEIAALLKVNKGSVGTILAWAKERFRQQYGPFFD